MIRRFIRNLSHDISRLQRQAEANRDAERNRQRKNLGYSDQTPIGFRSRANSSYFMR